MLLTSRLALPRTEAPAARSAFAKLNINFETSNPCRGKNVGFSVFRLQMPDFMCNLVAY